MSEMFYGRINIGGELPEDKVPEFLKAIQEDTGITYGTLDRIPKEEETLLIEDSEARNGMFNNLETWCQDNGLSYIRISSACDVYSAETVWWVPEMKEPMEVFNTQDQEPYIRKSDLEDILSFLDKVKDPKNASLLINDEKKWAMEVIEGNDDPIAFIRKRIDEICPNPPYLTSFGVKRCPV